jgi:transposase
MRALPVFAVGRRWVAGWRRAWLRRWLRCPKCEFTGGARFDTRPVFSTWRHTRSGPVEGDGTGRAAAAGPPPPPGLGWRRSPSPGTARGSPATSRAWWRTWHQHRQDDHHPDSRESTGIGVGRICERVVAEDLDPARRDGLVSIGADEMSWKRHQNCLALVTDHTGKKIVWCAEGVAI